jgi:peptidoglycan/LPS O-acetylase OafA/YrhL
MSNRIGYLDGLRGLAILLVIPFHAYVRWPEIVPYGDKYAHILGFKLGWLGVNLFFLISGFVILMTLEKCATFKEFIFRRWLRLFPAMLLCSLLIFFTSGYFYERPAGVPSISSLLPGLMFIEPKLLMALGISDGVLEGAFWSLYVEFKFYIFAACIYYWRGRNYLIAALLLAYTLAIAFQLTSLYVPNKSLIFINLTISKLLSFLYFGWFAVGAAFYIYSKTKDFRWFLAALLFAVYSSAFVSEFNANYDWKAPLAAFLVSSIFALALISQPLQRLLNSRFLQFFGFISYPLYLIHENMMISMIAKLGRRPIGIPEYLYPLLAVIVLSGIAYFIAAYGEKYLRGLILKITRQVALA